MVQQDMAAVHADGAASADMTAKPDCKVTQHIASHGMALNVGLSDALDSAQLSATEPLPAVLLEIAESLCSLSKTPKHQPTHAAQQVTKVRAQPTRAS